MVTTQGYNALLKLIEEPPDFLVFVFATTEPDKVLPTIRSRTHHYPFRLVPPGVLRAHLERICAAEGVTVEPAVLPLVVRAGGGSVRDSLSLLDQLLAGAGPEGLTYAQAVGLLGVTDAALLDDMVDALAVSDAAAVYGTVDRVVEAGHDPRRFAADLLDRFRDLIVLDAVPDAGERALIDAPQDVLSRMSDQAARIGGATLTRYAEIVHTALIEMRGTTAARLVLELLCARMQLPDAAADSAAMLQRIERLERGQALAQSGAGRPDAEVPATAPAAVPASEASPQAPETDAAQPRTSRPGGVGPIDAVGLRQIWPEVLDAAKRIKQRTRALLLDAQVLSVDADVITLSAPSAPLARMIGEETNLAVLRSALAEVVPGVWTVQVQAAPNAGRTAAAGTGRPSEPDPRDDADASVPPASAVDPETDALLLLRTTLGARPFDDS
jgi:DNA polymerase III subunit gamma/tau